MMSSCGNFLPQTRLITPPVINAARLLPYACIMASPCQTLLKLFTFLEVKNHPESRHHCHYKLAFHFSLLMFGHLNIVESTPESVEPNYREANGFSSGDQTPVTDPNANGISVEVDMGHASPP